MKRKGGILAPRGGEEKDFFIGWGDTPAADRRFLLGAIPAVIAGSGGLGYLVASELDDPGAGSWQTGATHEVTGVLVKDPYPMIRSLDEAGNIRTTLVVAEAKCTTSLDLAAADGGLYKASGVLIERKDRQMLEVPLALDKWLEPVSTSDIPDILVTPETLVEDVVLTGFIMDTKCFFGVMRPGRGQTHKACAALCIRGGIPPSFWVRTVTGREIVLLMTDEDGGPIGDGILPLVADAVEATGKIVRMGDLLQFRAGASAYRLRG